MLKFNGMKIRITKNVWSTFSLILLGLAIAVLVFSILVKKNNLLASATDETPRTDGDQSFITIFDNGEATTLRSGAITVGDLLDRAEIKIGKYDTVEPDLDTKIDSEKFNINIYRAHEAVIIDGKVKKYAHTAATEAESVVADANIKLYDEDIVNIVPYENILESGFNIAYQIQRAKAIRFDFYGKEMVVRTQADTIGEFLEEQGIVVDSKKTWASLKSDTKITDNIAFAVYRQGKQTKTVEETIKYGSRVTYDDSMTYGKRKVTKPGKNGKKTVTYEIEMRNGKEVSRKVISSIVNQKPVDEQVRVGMKLNLPAGSHTDWMAAAGISPSDYQYVNYIISHESGWRPNASNGRYHGLYQTDVGRLTRDCGSNWVNNPVCQLKSATKYATGRYGSWSNAFHKWKAQGWW